MKTKKALFGMGCFWWPQRFFNEIEGVVRTTVGYAGGEKEDPTYHDLGDHSEVVLVEYNPSKISYGELLELFFANHDPTVKQKTQYRSVIFYYDRKQLDLAEEKLKEYREEADRTVQTKIEKFNGFTKAEDYHQNYLDKNKGIC